MGKKSAAFLARAGIIAGLYAALTVLLAPLSYGAVQCRLSEAMAVLPVIFPEAVPGLVLGCLSANIYSGFWADAVFGTLATAIAAVLTYIIGKFVKKRPAAILLGGIPPVAVNALVLPSIWLLFSADAAYFVNLGAVATGQTVAVYALGVPLCFALSRVKRVFCGANIE